MTRAMTTDEKATSRLPHAAAALAAFYIPAVIYTAHLASVPASTDEVAEISFNTGAGTLANVKANMSLYVSNVASGKNELGICRIRKAPIAGTFYIGEQSKVNWNVGGTIYLTVVEDFDLNPKHIHMDGSVPKMDYDIAFSDQHTNMNPVPILGPIVRVKKLIDSSVDVQLGSETAYNSYCIGSSISSYVWTCATATFDNAALARPVATFTTTGWHVLYCLITAANSKTTLGVRFVYIYSDDDPPLTAFVLNDYTESAQDGGISFELDFFAQADLATIPNRSLCVLFTEEQYGDFQNVASGSIGPVPDAENIVGIGRILSERMNFDVETGNVGFTIAGYQELMKRVNGFPSGVLMNNNPTEWTHMPALTVKRGLWHFLEWRTTATQIMDVIITDDARYSAETSSLGSNLWAQMEEFCFNQILFNTRVDHLGRFFAEPEPLLIPVADRAYPTILDLEYGAIEGKLELSIETISSVGQVDLSGIVVDLSAQGTGYRAFSPGHVPDRTGSIEPVDRLLLTGQAQALELAGLIFAVRNNPYKLKLALAVNNRFVTCFPNQCISLTIAAENNPRGLALTVKFIPRQRQLRFDTVAGFWSTELEFDMETSQEISVIGEVPGSGDLSQLPDVGSWGGLPDFNVILPGSSDPDDGGPKTVLIHDGSAGLAYSTVFDADFPIWSLWNSGLTTAQYQDITHIWKTPSGAIYVAKVGDFLDESSFLARASSIGGVFTILEDTTTMRAKFAAAGIVNPAERTQFQGLGINLFYSDRVFYCIGLGGYAKLFYIGGAGTYTQTALDVAGDFLGGTDISYGGGTWMVTGRDNQKIISSDGGTQITNYAKTSTRNKHLRASTSTKTIHWEKGNSDLYVGSNNLASVVHLTPSPGLQNQGLLAIDPTGLLLLTSNSIGTAYKSSDGGSSFASIGTLPVLQSWGFDFAGGAGIDTSRWIGVSDGGYVYYTDDFWTTIHDKRGNLTSIIPTPHLNLVKVISS